LSSWPGVCAAVIPCLNEQEAVGPVVERVRRRLPHVLVIDDGSTDKTADAARRAGATVLTRPVSGGKGAALQTGWSWAVAKGFDWAVCLDGDGQHSPDDIPKFFSTCERTSASLVVGNRMQDTARMPAVRRCVNRLMSWQLSILAGQSLPDSQCGFRLMNLRHWARLAIEGHHFEIESEVLFQFARAGLKIEFVPIQVIYKQEQSKIHPWKDTVRWLKWRQNAKRLGPGAPEPPT
jgi:glycosyltransferase involved in cell wall biosynthesis